MRPFLFSVGHSQHGRKNAAFFLSLLLSASGHNLYNAAASYLDFSAYQLGDLRLSYLPPNNDGGEPITKYKVEWDASNNNNNAPTFSPSSQYFGSEEVTYVREEQEIVLSCPTACSGTFALSWGGRVSVPLNVDATSEDVEMAINDLVEPLFTLQPAESGESTSSSSLVRVTRKANGFGYKWRVVFAEISGDVGSILADGDLLIGNGAGVRVLEIIPGSSDLYPGAYTNEVQTVSVRKQSGFNCESLGGAFSLGFEGKTTSPISVKATAEDFKNALELLDTIHTVNVYPDHHDSIGPGDCALRSWIVAFTHLVHENRQGAGDLGFLSLSSSSLVDPAVTHVDIFENIKGTNPRIFNLRGLEYGLTYHCRVLAYNSFGYGVSSSIVSATPVIQPLPPSNVNVSIPDTDAYDEEGTSLLLNWDAVDDVVNNGGDPVSEYKIEWYSSVDNHEIQKLTTSSSDGITEIQSIKISADSDGITGYFRLVFNGETSDLISHDADADGEESLEVKLERLSTIGDVEVRRELSWTSIPDVEFSLSSGSNVLSIVGGSASVDSFLSIGDPVKVGGEQHVVSSIDGSFITLSDAYTGPSANNVLIYRWSYGYEWFVTFNSHIGEQPLIEAHPADNWAGTNPVIEVSRVRKGVKPLSGTMRLGFEGERTRPIPFDADATLVKQALELLTTIGEVDVTRYTNNNGHNYFVTFLSELGDREQITVDDSLLMGPDARARVATIVDGTEPSDYGHAYVEDHSSLVIETSSLQYQIKGLRNGVPYYIRIRSRNTKGFGYARLVSSSPTAPIRPPSPPKFISLFPLSDTLVRVVWEAPEDDGGSSIEKYALQWDTDPSFASGHFREVFVGAHDTEGTTTRYCDDFPIVHPSSSLSSIAEQYARVLSFNGYKWSDSAESVISSTTPIIGKPGPVLDFNVFSTSNLGMMMTWNPPNPNIEDANNSCGYAGDGGAPITNYMIEYDSEADFASPAISVVVPSNESSYRIGGRDVLTGSESPVLEAGGTYYVRITAFNAQGSGTTVTFPEAVGPLRDTDPGTPSVLNAVPLSASSVKVEWDTPSLDGGSVLQEYIVEYDTASDFDIAPKNISTPVVSEVKGIQVGLADLNLNIQTIEATVAVTNEVQSIRTEIVGVDEIQEITTTCDDVVAEVQMIVTNAVDTNEEQVLSLMSDDVDEIQLVRLRGNNQDEIQKVQVSVGRVNEVQRLGIVISNINTDGDGVHSTACIGNDVGEPCAEIEAALGGSFTVSFDFDECGGDGSVNYCQLALSKYEPSLGTVVCSPGLVLDPYAGGDHCVSGPVSYSSSSVEGEIGTLQYVINNLVDDNGVSFMTLPNAPGKRGGVTVTREGRIKTKGSCALDGSCSGEYEVVYEILFDSVHTSGDVPPVTVVASDFRVDTTSSSYLNTMCPSDYYVNGCETPVGSAASSEYGSFYDGEAGSVAFESVKGTQPRGMISLDYECESRVTKLPVSFSMTIFNGGMSASFDADNFVVGMSIGQLIRFSSGDGIDFYRKISGIDVDTNSVQLATRAPTDGVSYQDVEFGDYFSDYDGSNGDLGVSSHCMASRMHTTLSLDVDIYNEANSVVDWKGKIGALPVIESSGISVSRDIVSDLSTEVGLRWEVTFLKQPGHVHQMSCNHVSGTNECSVETTQDSSLIDGNFRLQTTWPHEYVSESIEMYETTTLRWNADANDVKNALESVTDLDGNKVFGLVSVTRSPYVASTHLRWSGGYQWVITFLSRGGNIPAMTSDDSAIVGMDVVLEISDEDSGVSDLFQGLRNSASFGTDDPGLARDGNQVSGSFALYWDGNTYHDSVETGEVFPIQTGGSSTDQFTALTAEGFKALIEEYVLGGDSDGQQKVDVTRSELPTQWMGFSYTIVFRHEDVGGDVPPLIHKQGSSLHGQNSYVHISESVKGTEIAGTFQLRFEGETTRQINYDATALDVQEALNELNSITPSAVVVSGGDNPVRSGPSDGNAGMSTQVGGRIWYVTFASNTWRDPTVVHDASFVPGNWVGPPTSYSDTWNSGFSKGWGKNVGNVPMMSCLSSGLTTTNGALPTSGCSVHELVPGTDPLGGVFKVCLDSFTSPNGIMSVESNSCTDFIAYNAVASADESGGDGSSMEEKLEQLDNIGDVHVTRGAINTRNGGYTWKVTFLHDADGPCDQKDDIHNMCNSPGDVPKFCGDLTACDTSSLLGTCLSPNTCHKLGVLDQGGKEDGRRFPGGNEKQVVLVKDTSYVGWKDGSIISSDESKEFKLIVGGVETSCIPNNASADDMRMAIQSALDDSGGIGGGVRVHRVRTEDLAENGFAFYLTFYDTGNIDLLDALYSSTSCPHNFEPSQSVVVSPILDGSLHPYNCNGCTDGIVQRGKFTTFEVHGDNLGGDLAWNASPSDVKAHLEQVSGRTVVASRSVLDKYGTIEWTVTFTENAESIPPGSGDVQELVVTQDQDTSNRDAEILINEVVKGSEGLHGTFDLDYASFDGPRTFSYDETSVDMMQKLEEMSTIGNVFVTKDCFPSCTTGGWGGSAVAPGTVGGYKWVVHFLRNPGSDKGVTFPPGSGFISPPSIDDTSLLGNDAAVTMISPMDGSDPLLGTFNLVINGETTAPIPYNAGASALEQSINDLQSVGDVTVTSGIQALLPIAGIYANIVTDSNVASIVGGDLREHFAPGDVFRIGGSATEIDGAEFFGTASLTPFSPILTNVQLNNVRKHIHVGETIRVGGETYTVVKNGIEVQLIAVHRSSDVVPNGNFYQLQFAINGATEVTSCLSFDASAMDVETALNDALSNLSDNGEVFVTRTNDTSGYAGDAHLYKVYFVGDGLIGDVDEMLVESCSDGIPAGVDSTNSHVHIRTLVQGGRTEHQRITLSSDAGSTSETPAVRLSVMDSNSNSWESPCFVWGASSLDLSTAIDAGVFSSALLTVEEVTTFGDNQYKIEASTFVEGIILVGDVVNPGNRCPGRVISIGNDGKSILIESASGCETSSGDDLFVNSDITIIESSTNDSHSTSKITLLEIYADGEITSNDDVGLYKLTVDLGGISRTTECLPFGAYAEDIKEQVGLLFDYNHDGVIDDLDKDHISIVRDGDGSSSSGFGYTYKIISSGSKSTFGSSATLGSNAPSFFVAHIGADGGCEDYGSNDVLVTSTASTTDESNVVLLDPNTITNIVAGTRFRASSSLDPSKIYTVDHIQAGNMAVILTEPFYGSTIAGSVLIYLVHGAVPQFNVVVVQEGADEYVYDLFFTGSHWSDVPQVHVNTFGDGTCSASSADMIGGMNRNIGIKTIVDGGGTIESAIDTYVVDKVARYDQVGMHNLYEVPPTLSILDMGSITPQFTSNQLPLGRGDRWIGESRFNLPIYRVSGTYWLVRFGQTLGNISQMSIDSASLPPNAQTSVTNVLSGVNPDHVTIPHLSTGIPYYFRVYARNSNFAFSSYSNVVSAVPSGKPEVMSMVSSNNALHRNEVQKVVLAASHRKEVQTITTSAISIPEVQEITLEGTVDSDMNSYFFSLRHPEIQVVKLSAGSPVTSGSFFLKLRYVDITQSSLLGSLVYKEMKSSCIPYDASAEEVKRAIEIDALADPLGSNSVRVVRSGSHSYSSDYGYVYKISFEGSNVRGNMPEISSDDFELTGLDSIGGTSCDPFVTSTNDASLEIWTENESFALGTDTPRAELVVDANVPIVEGGYQLSVTHFGQQVMTPCIPWNAGPSELELALESLTNIDSVRVDSTGSGILSDNGAQIHLNDYPFEAAGPDSFSTSEDISGILFQGDTVSFSNQMDSTALYEVISVSGNTLVIDRPFEGLDNDVTTYQVTRYFGNRHIVYFDGNAMHTTGADATGFMPLQGGNFDVVEPNSCNPPKSYHNNVLKQVSDIPGGKASIRVISKYDGEHTLPGALSTESSTVIRNTLLAALPMRIGEAQVTQSLETSSNGLTFTITYGNDDGNVPLLVCNQPLLTSMVSCQTGTVMDANEIRGNFYLESSDPIPYDATPSEMESAISSISGVGSIDVTRTLAADGQGGYTWNVTFTGSHGDVPLLRASNSLTGKGAIPRPEIQRITTSVPPSSSLSGFFIVSFSPYGTFTSHSTNIAFDATAEDFKTALESIEGIGTLEVSRQDCDNPSITCTWDVTFASFVGEANLLEPDYSRLMIN